MCNFQAPQPHSAADQQERQVRHAGNQAHHAEQRGRDGERSRIAEQLLRDFAAHVLGARHASHDDGHRRRQQQRRHLCDQAVADRQRRIDARRIAEAHVVRHHADADAAENVDDQDQDAGRRVAAHELAGTVHRTVEVRFGTHFGAADFGFILRDQAGVQVGVDRHLLAGHGIEGEARADFGDAPRALGDDDEVDDGQDREHDDADRVVAADDELAEGFDDRAGRVAAGVTVQQHDAGRGDVERQAQQRGQQQHGREHAELERPRDVEHRHHHDQRQRDVEGEQHVQRDRRQRQHHHREHRQHTDGHADARAQDRADVQAGLAVAVAMKCLLQVPYQSAE